LAVLPPYVARAKSKAVKKRAGDGGASRKANQKGEIMNRKVLVAAVAAAFVAPAAFAQSSVTVGGTINILWDTVRGSNSTGAIGDLKSHDRVRDGAGSNIRFTVIEDLGGGNSAFVQVESAVIQNSDQRADLVGNVGTGVTTSGNSTAVWGNRNSGIGIRSKAAGRFLIGVWDVHYHEHYTTDPAWIPGNSAWSTLALTQNMGSGLNVNPAFGGRLSNVIRWDSPNWSGFSMAVTYARPTDGAPNNTAGDVREGKKNRNWSISPRYEMGGLSVVYSYMQDKDAATTATLSIGGALLAAGANATSTWKITSNRLGVRYKFAMGLGIGALWDVGKVSNTTVAAANQVSIKRTVWAFPITYDTGNHHLMATWARARDWRGQIGGVGLGTPLAVAIGTSPAGTYNFGSDTGASFFSLGYMYNLSQRTNVSVGYARTRNDALVRYDMFANGTGNTSIGVDPRSFSVGLRHTF
jgi:predicted porin